jgi:hypothetical protein
MRTVLIISQVIVLAILAVVGAHGDSRASIAQPVNAETSQSL